jgi:hypothetical protein
MVKGAPVETIAELYAAGEPVETIADEHGLTRDDVLVALWHTGTYGTRTEKAWLGTWAVFAGKLMWHGHWGEVEDPPAKPKRDAK